MSVGDSCREIPWCTRGEGGDFNEIGVGLVGGFIYFRNRNNENLM